jgi:hypothetical protein
VSNVVRGRRLLESSREAVLESIALLVDGIGEEWGVVEPRAEVSPRSERIFDSYKSAGRCGDGPTSLPASGSRPSFEWAANVGGYPTTVEIARLRLDLEFIHRAPVDTIRIEGHVVAQQLILRRRVRVRPGGILAEMVAYVDTPVVSGSLELTPGAGSGRLKQVASDVYGRDVVDGRVAGFEDAETGSRVGDELAAEADLHVAATLLDAGRARVVPD